MEEKDIFNLEIEKPKPRFTIKGDDVSTTPAPAAEKKNENQPAQEIKVEPKVEAKKEIKKEEKPKTDEDIVTLTKDLSIRQYPGTWEHILTYKQIAKEDKKNIIKGQVPAIYKAGTEIKVLKRINVIGEEVWGQTRSGYILLSKGKDINYK